VTQWGNAGAPQLFWTVLPPKASLQKDASGSVAVNVSVADATGGDVHRLPAPTALSGCACCDHKTEQVVDTEHVTAERC
jgi:hypothetical protein